MDERARKPRRNGGGLATSRSPQAIFSGRRARSLLGPSPSVYSGARVRSRRVDRSWPRTIRVRRDPRKVVARSTWAIRRLKSNSEAVVVNTRRSQLAGSPIQKHPSSVSDSLSRSCGNLFPWPQHRRFLGKSFVSASEISCSTLVVALLRAFLSLPDVSHHGLGRENRRKEGGYPAHRSRFVVRLLTSTCVSDHDRH